MTEEEIIELSIQAGIKHRTDEFYSEFCYGVYFDDLVTFAKLIAEKEREECAKTAENISSYDRDEPEVSIAKAIRERGKDA